MKRAAAVGGVLAMTMVAAGCASPSDPAQATPARYVERASVTQAARQAHGDEAVRAYQEMADLMLQESVDPALLDPGRTPTAAELSAGIVDHMTPATQRVWNGYVTKAVAGDKASNDIVSLLRLHGVNQVAARPELRLPPGTDVVTSQTISGAKIDVAPKTGTVTPLQISFHHAARLDYRERRAPYPASVDRDVTFRVVPASTVSASDSTATTGASTSTATAAPTAVAPAAGATWLITQFEGTTSLSFDRGDEPSSTSTESSTPSGAATSAG